MAAASETSRLVSVSELVPVACAVRVIRISTPAPASACVLAKSATPTRKSPSLSGVAFPRLTSVVPPFAVIRKFGFAAVTWTMLGSYSKSNWKPARPVVGTASTTTSTSSVPPTLAIVLQGSIGERLFT